MLPVVLTDEALRQRLNDLATAAGLPVPPVEEDGKEGRQPRIRGREGRERIVVPPELFEAPPAEQTWHLAICLGWWASREPRRRRRQTLIGLGLALGLLGVAAIARIEYEVYVPTLALLVPYWLAGEALHHRERRALEAAGFGVLAAAGHDPAMLTRQVFADRWEPPAWKRWLTGEPSARRRIAHAEAWRP